MTERRRRSTWRDAPVPRAERDPTPVSDALDRITVRLGGPRAGVFSAVFSRWEQLVGPDIAAHSRPVSLRSGTLVLAVDHPAWATQLRYMTTDLLARISAAAGPGEVSAISLRVTGDPGPRPRRPTRS